jgi:uncharacterized protein (DUF1330 family)
MFERNAMLAATAIVMVACGAREPSKGPSMSHDTPRSDRYHQVVLLWNHDAAKFSRYQELVAPIVAPHGGRLDRQLRPVQAFGDGLTLPDTINLVSNPTRDAFDAFNRDPRFQEIVHLRTESITMMAASGPALRGALSLDEEQPPGRVYLLELAQLGPRGLDGYLAYEREAEPTLARYGYHVALVFRPDAAQGLPFKPDLVKLAYFDAQDGMDRMHGDPRHAHIENELYPAAAPRSLWIVGSATR